MAETEQATMWRRVRGWLRAGSPRDTLAFRLALLALGTFSASLVWHGRYADEWTTAVGLTFLFAAAIAGTDRFRWVSRFVFGSAMLHSWWQLYRAAGR